MLRLSIVIPVLGRSKQLDDTLVSVLENRPADCEIIVVHTRPYDDPYDLAGEVRFLKARRRAGIGGCLNLALSVCKAPVVHVIACGVEVCPGWADAALRRFVDPHIVAVAAMLLDSNERQSVVSAGLAYHAGGTVWRIDQGRNVLEAEQRSARTYRPRLVGRILPQVGAGGRRPVFAEMGVAWHGGG